MAQIINTGLYTAVRLNFNFEGSEDAVSINMNQLIAGIVVFWLSQNHTAYSLVSLKYII